MARYNLLLLLLIAGLSACSGGGSSMSTPTNPLTPPMNSNLPAGNNTGGATIPVIGDPMTMPMPMVGAFSGTIALSKSTAPAGAQLTVTSSLTAPSGAMAQSLPRTPQGTGNITVLFFLTFTSSADITFTSLPGFSINLANSALAAGQAFYAVGQTAPGVSAAFTTEGPAVVSNTNLAFSPATTNFTLKAGQPTLFEFYVNVEVSKGNGNFYAFFGGPQRPSVDLLQATGEFSKSTSNFTFSALMAGPVLDGNTNFYIIGLDRGNANNAPFQGEPNVNFNSVVAVTVPPGGSPTGAITLIPGGPAGTLPAGAIQINGAKIQITVASSLFPPTGSNSAAGYVWNIWTRVGVGGDQSQIGSFIPENAMAPFVPAP
jgi:hypothetical protein